MSETTSDAREAFDREALPHLDAVFRYALQLTGNHSLAEDLTQDVYLKAFRAFSSYSAGTNIRAWLFTIVRNLQIDHHRRDVNRPGTVPLDVVADPEQEAEEPIGELVENFDQEVLRELRDLGEEFRQALVLCDVEGLSYRDVSEVMGCPVGTVRSRISRARAVLRERLAPHASRIGLIMTPQEQANEL